MVWVSNLRAFIICNDEHLYLFNANEKVTDETSIAIKDLSDPQLDEQLHDFADELREEVELVEGVYEPLDEQQYLEGKLAPVFFGSALNNFGVKELLDTFTQIAPAPGSRPTDAREVQPEEAKFSGFVFKIHANIDPRHRDRLAFLRICSGQFERNKFFHHVRLDKKMRFSSPATFMADGKSIVDEAWPGDVVGLYDNGSFKIGDTLTEGESLQFKGIPSFSPEIFKELVNTDPMKSKQLEKGVQQLTDEGVAQLFTQQPGNRKIIGAVGELQFEVIQYRLLHEYGASCRFQSINVGKACWMTWEDDKVWREFSKYKMHHIAQDKDNNYVYLAENQWMLNVAIENNPELTFHFTSEFKVG